MPRLITAVSAPTFRRPLARLVAPSSALGDLKPVGHKSADATAPSAAKGRLRLSADATAPSAARGRLRVKADATAPSSAKGTIKAVGVGGYLKARRIIVPHGGVRPASLTPGAVAVDLPNFPFCVQLSGAWLKWTGNDAANGRIQSPNGYDIRFEDAAGNKLDHDLELWDGVAGQLVAWVRIPVLSASADTTVWLRYDKASQATAEENKAGVWRDYLAVIRFPSGADVTGNGRGAATLTAIGSGTLVGPAGAFDGSTSYGYTAAAPWLDGLSALTLQVRQKAGTTPQGGTWCCLRAGDDWSTANNFIFRWTPVSPSGTANTVYFKALLSGAQTVDVEGPANCETTSALGVAVTWASGAQPVLYLGGAAQVPTGGHAFSGSTALGGGKLVLGTEAVANAPAREFYNGLYDEIRIAGSALTPGRIATEEACITDPASFYGIGDEEDTAGASSIVALPVAATGTVGTAGVIDVAAAAFVPTGVANPSVSSVGPASDGGAVVVNAAGKAKYTPAAAGADRFPFSLLSGGKTSASVALVTVSARVGGGAPMYVPALPPNQQNITSDAQLTSFLNGSPNPASVYAFVRLGTALSARTLNQAIGSKAHPLYIVAERNSANQEDFTNRASVAGLRLDAPFTWLDGLVHKPGGNGYCVYVHTDDGFFTRGWARCGTGAHGFTAGGGQTGGVRAFRTRIGLFLFDSDGRTGNFGDIDQQFSQQVSTNPDYWDLYLNAHQSDEAAAAVTKGGMALYAEPGIDSGDPDINPPGTNDYSQHNSFWRTCYVRTTAKFGAYAKHIPNFVECDAAFADKTGKILGFSHVFAYRGGSSVRGKMLRLRAECSPFVKGGDSATNQSFAVQSWYHELGWCEAVGGAINVYCLCPHCTGTASSYVAVYGGTGEKPLQAANYADVHHNKGLLVLGATRDDYSGGNWVNDGIHPWHPIQNAVIAAHTGEIVDDAGKTVTYNGTTGAITSTHKWITTTGPNACKIYDVDPQGRPAKPFFSLTRAQAGPGSGDSRIAPWDGVGIWPQITDYT